MSGFNVEEILNQMKECEGFCAKCGEELDTEDMDSKSVGDGVALTYECDHCGHTGKQHYNLVYAISD